MNAQQLLNEILPLLHSVKEDKEKLQKILDFLLEEIYEEPDEIEPEIPEKYRELVHTVAENIDCGLVCFINPETLEVEEIPKAMFDDPVNDNILKNKLLNALNNRKPFANFKNIVESSNHRAA